MRTFKLQTWPSTDWVTIAKGYEWITLRKCPVPYIHIRELGSDDDTLLFVGSPAHIDPTKSYQIQNIADRDIDLLTSPGPTVGTMTMLLRETELCLSDECPSRGGNIQLAASFTKIQAASWTTSGALRFTTAEFSIASVYSAGVITWAGVYGWDPNTGAFANGAIVALNNNCASVALHKDGAVEAQVNRRSGRGATEYVAFPVTTTPTVILAVEQFRRAF